MAVRIKFENSCDIGVYASLTNSYCLVASGGGESFFSTFAAELEHHIPVVHAFIGGCRIIGAQIVGNKHGLLVPSITTDQELQHLRDSLPDTVVIQRIEERHSALGNVIACNDYVGLIHPNLDKESEDIIADVLQIEVFRHTIDHSVLTGSHCVLSNHGCLLPPFVSVQDMQEAASLLQVPVAAGTVNRGQECLGGGMVVNDWCAFVGADTTSMEISQIENIFRLGEQGNPERITTDMRNDLIAGLTTRS
ncbi:eukaryotic translation initiation factor 6-like [Zophobas morio]|uniref:eukaryotic translation initiation factor 6-like n=1 Tax=Zophobas morio TaxID=2755281 RepID=UPI0030837FBC